MFKCSIMFNKCSKGMEHFKMAVFSKYHHILGLDNKSTIYIIDNVPTLPGEECIFSFPSRLSKNVPKYFFPLALPVCLEHLEHNTPSDLLYHWKPKKSQFKTCSNYFLHWNILDNWNIYHMGCQL